jgi:DNA-binding NarL/FixJ family response regulator
VARLAADGLRNADIAAHAHLSLKTVEAVLSRSYRKLGIRSRAQLERALTGVAAKPDG